MGNVFGYKKENGSEQKELNEFDENKHFPNRKHVDDKSDSEGSENDLNEDRNHLELVLDDVYKNECKFQIKKEEITFIQTGIETLVKKIVEKVHKNILVKDFSGVEICEYEILKVGSFYEGTRNKFPDEFDFIYVFCKSKQDHDYGHDISQFRYLLDVEFDKCFQPACKLFEANQYLKYQSYEEFTCNKREILFCGYVQKHGPARLLQFVYHRQSGETKVIYVDLVPAIRLKDVPNMGEVFFQEIYSFGKCLFVGCHISFTEAEVHIMKNILSKKHIKVYRILKFLINGHGDDEDLKKILNKIRDRQKQDRSSSYRINYPAFPSAITVSSYMIKCKMTEHHKICKNNHTENAGPCLIEVLVSICSEYFNPMDLFGVHLQIMIQSFKECQEGSSKNVIQKKSASRQFIDQLIQEDYL